MEPILKEIKAHIHGEVWWDTFTRNIYSVDASIYEVQPLAVIIPQDVEDVLLTLQLAAEHHIPVTARGAATGITGSCLGKGLILDLSVHLNKILHIDIEKEYAIVEPGVVQDRLNEALAPDGYRLGPDTSTGNRATIGGMVANNSAGARSLFYGRMCDHVLDIDLALAGGTLMKCGPLTKAELSDKQKLNTHEGPIYREISNLLFSHEAAIRAHFPKIPRHVSGYNLDLLLDSKPFNLCKLIAGSEGTLGIATKIKVGIAKMPKHTGLCLIPLDDMIRGMEMIESMLAYSPLALEMIDDKILKAAKAAPSTKGKLNWLQSKPEAIFVAEFQGDTPADVEAKLRHFLKGLQRHSLGPSPTLITDPQQIMHVWEVRKAGLGLLLSRRSYSRAISFIEDVAVAPQKLASFMKSLLKYLKSVGKEAGIYGHVGAGCMHIRPYINLHKIEDVRLMKQMMLEVSSLVLEHGGSMSGEHGDGLIRSWLNEKMFGQEVYEAFQTVKNAFDPHNLMNPGKIVDGPSLLQDLRSTPQTPQKKIKTFLDFSREGGIELAADLCNGNGQCRKMETVMCPSFQASGDEYLTTRARAQSLRAIINGKFPQKTFTSKELFDVLDLCIECKGCQHECPSQVDMAKMKAEFLYHYHKKHGYPLRSKVFGHLHKLLKTGSLLASLMNRVKASTYTKVLLNGIGIASERQLPALAKVTFSQWHANQPRTNHHKKAILFSDTYSEFIQPEIGIAASRILDALGYEISLISGYCCGRPLISKGMLKQAKRYAHKTSAAIAAAARQNTPIIVLEPSCLSAFRDDYNGLLDNNYAHDNIFSLEEFLQQHIGGGILPLPFTTTSQEIFVHGHCHQKALVGMSPTLQVLRTIPGWKVHEIGSGCCGMAGSFGYEKEHYNFSLKIGELKLFPAVRQTSQDACLIASGFSCRSQIGHGTGKQALHLAEAIAKSL